MKKMKKTRIIAIFIIAGLLTALTIINARTSKSQTREEFITQEVNYTTTTQTTLTTSKKVPTTTIKKATKKVTMKVNASQQEILDYLHQEVLNMGWSSSDYEIIVKLLINESGINPNSYNKKSTACGLFQAKPCSKAIKAYPDYLTNYKSQVKWGLNYIKDRYKTPSNAWKFWQEHKWY